MVSEWYSVVDDILALKWSEVLEHGAEVISRNWSDGPVPEHQEKSSIMVLGASLLWSFLPWNFGKLKRINFNLCNERVCCQSWVSSCECVRSVAAQLTRDGLMPMLSAAWKARVRFRTWEEKKQNLQHHTWGFINKYINKPNIYPKNNHKTFLGLFLFRWASHCLALSHIFVWRCEGILCKTKHRPHEPSPADLFYYEPV